MNCSLNQGTVFILLNATAFIKSLLFSMRHVFKGRIYSRAAFISKSLFFKSLTTVTVNRL